jgi:hypothetical protein
MPPCFELNYSNQQPLYKIDPASIIKAINMPIPNQLDSFKKPIDAEHYPELSVPWSHIIGPTTGIIGSDAKSGNMK